MITGIITGIILFCVALGLLFLGADWLVQKYTQGMRYDQEEGCFRYVNDNDYKEIDDENN